MNSSNVHGGGTIGYEASVGLTSKPDLSRSVDISDLAALASRYRLKLDRIKREQHNAGFGWYPYDSFSVFPVLAKMLREERRALLSLAGVAPVLDMGCGDGDLSFFFESLGCKVVAIDRPETNYNGTRGFATLQQTLGSSVTLDETDLDNGHHLKGRTFGLAMCLGLLYHLRNPFGFLEELAHHVRYCILSTRIAEHTGRGTRIAEEPVAYLVGAAEANNDSTNYWIFSQAGLRQIIDRTGWDLCDYSTTGTQHGSEPSDPNRDQRAFCMVRSRLSDPWLEVELEGGWHEMEKGMWRWTEREFAIRLPRPAPEEATLRFQFVVPDHLIRVAGSIRLRAAVGGIDLPRCEYTHAGEHIYAQQVPHHALAGDSVLVRFELDKVYGPTEADKRELGVQVIFWSYSESTPRNLRPIALG